MVLINPSSTGTPITGSGYTLTCIALKSASGLTQSAVTLWRGPRGGAVATNGTTVLSGAVTESLRTVQNITFGSLSTSNAGVYTCEATLSSPALATPYQATQSYTVTVSGIFMHHKPPSLLTFGCYFMLSATTKSRSVYKYWTFYQ